MNYETRDWLEMEALLIALAISDCQAHCPAQLEDTITLKHTMWKWATKLMTDSGPEECFQYLVDRINANLAAMKLDITFPN